MANHIEQHSRAAEIDDTSPIVIGATAGVRQALEKGIITEAKVAMFRKALNAQFGNRAVLRILTGQEEGEAEIAGARHVYKALTTGHIHDIDQASMLSAGGASGQVPGEPC